MNSPGRVQRQSPGRGWNTLDDYVYMVGLRDILGAWPPSPCLAPSVESIIWFYLSHILLGRSRLLVSNNNNNNNSVFIQVDKPQPQQ